MNPNPNLTDPRSHVLAVVDSMDDAQPTLSLAKDVVDHGGRATVLIHLGDTDRTHITDYASSEGLSLGEAEARYIDSTLSNVRDFVGHHGTNAVITDSVRDGAAVIQRALKSDATSVAVPSDLAGRRSWRRAMAQTPVQLIVAPRTAA